ncbi:MAG: fibronectin type III-like domain-contianing protein [Tannerellaceae bacterium]|nr:fibronectin type III-like domain-contianing protein [Tannerellaceae bacterium]MCD8264236.1 fibronectin type III-like domain-contianing protein [Tannerellaceae bacterium]
MVQLYIRDVIASVAQPVLQLKGFEKVALNPEETCEVSFEITPEMLKMYDKYMNHIVEPGEFRIMIGASCKDIRLRDNLVVVKDF